MIDKRNNASLAWKLYRQLIIELPRAEPDTEEERRVLRAIERCWGAMREKDDGHDAEH